MPDEVLRARGYDYNSAVNLFTFNGAAADQHRLDLLRILNSCVVETPNGELDNLGTPGFTGTGIVSTFGGEAIKYNGNQIITAGTIDRSLTVTIDSVKTAKNGRVIYLNNLLFFTTLNAGSHLNILGTPVTAEYNLYWNYLKSSTVYETVTNSIPLMAAGSFYTILAPNNNAIRLAITAGLLPGTVAAPLFNPTSITDKTKVANFMLYHIIDKTIIIPDKKNIGVFPTLFRTSNGDPGVINVQYPANVLEISDQTNVRKARLIIGATNQTSSNQLSNRTVIQLLDNYLKYP